MFDDAELEVLKDCLKRRQEVLYEIIHKLESKVSISHDKLSFKSFHERTYDLNCNYNMFTSKDADDLEKYSKEIDSIESILVKINADIQFHRVANAQKTKGDNNDDNSNT